MPTRSRSIACSSARPTANAGRRSGSTWPAMPTRNGYANDPLANIWRYRDWVIDAFNRNLPFDRFTIEQLAGDLLPNPTLEQLIATAFHRNTLTNTEGGTDREEFRVAAVVDRVNTTMQVWMGLTMGCAQCHNHKYDPISQKEYFQRLRHLQPNRGCRQAGQVARPCRQPLWANGDRNARAGRGRLRKLEKTFATRRVRGCAAKWEETDARREAAAEGRRFLRSPAGQAQAQQQRTEWPALQHDGLPSAKRRRPTRRASQKQLAAISSWRRRSLRELPEGQAAPTHVHVRGNFLDKASRSAPACRPRFMPLPAQEPVNRLTLARWLVSPDNPLTARVAVNRFWEQIFGIGLVETTRTSACAGKLPIHPELLDWLASRNSRTGLGRRA